MKIAVDAMGGDSAPGSVVKGVIDALREKQTEFSIILVGKEDAIKREIEKNNGVDLGIEIVNADDVVGMCESPSKAYKSKPNSSINITIKLQAEGKVQASLSGGNTGALLLASTFIQGRLKNIQRPAIALIMPSLKGPCVFLDAGANSDSKPQHLLQFGIMGSAYAKAVLDIENPRVGLLSVGEEKSKGNELTKETYPLLEQSNLNFIGNIESQKVVQGGVDVIVCDGFVGNIVLKLVETIPSVVKMFSNSSEDIGRFDYAENGGGLFLGADGVCVKAHGGSSVKGIKTAIFTAEKIARKNVNKLIEEYIENIS